MIKGVFIKSVHYSMNIWAFRGEDKNLGDPAIVVLTRDFNNDSFFKNYGDGIEDDSTHNIYDTPLETDQNGHYDIGTNESDPLCSDTDHDGIKDGMKSGTVLGKGVPSG